MKAPPGRAGAVPHAAASGSARGDPSTLDVADVARMLEADLENGLSSGEAARRLARDGPNVLRAVPPIPRWRRILAQFQDPLIYLLLGAIAIAVVAVVIAVIVVLNGLLGYAQEAKARNAVAALSRMTAVTSAVLRDGRMQRVPSAQLVRGDLLLLGEGDAVGADARLVEVASLRVQEASLTGESEAVLSVFLSSPARALRTHG